MPEFPEPLFAFTNPAHPLPNPHSASTAIRTSLRELAQNFSGDALLPAHVFLQPDPWADIVGASVEGFLSRQNCPEGQN